MAPVATMLTLVPAWIALTMSVVRIVVAVVPDVAKALAREPLVVGPVELIVTVDGSNNHSVALTVMPLVPNRSPEVST